MVPGLLLADAGEVSVAGNRITPTACENLAFMGSLYGLRGNELQRPIVEVLEIVGLADRAEDRIEEYSGGMKRRINIGSGCCIGRRC